MAQGTKRMIGWRYAALVGGLVGAIALAMYPIAISPYLYPQKWRKYVFHTFHGVIVLIVIFLKIPNVKSY